MSRLLRRASLRFYVQHPGQLCIAIAGIGLGVGVYVGVQLANDSAAQAFELSAALLRGQTSHSLLPVGRDLDETIYRNLVMDHGIATAAPVVEAEVGIATRAGLRVPLLGVDPIQERGLRGFSRFAPAAANGDLTRLITEPGTVLLPEALATELDVEAGMEVTLSIGAREVVVTALGTVSGIPADVAAEPPILADIATAQELLGQSGRLSRIDLLLTGQEAQELGSTPYPGTILAAVEQQGSGFDELAAAFRTNLTALGLLALVVGMFLIYGTMSFAILQRRPTLGVLRALGVSRGEIISSVLVEACAVALAATALGLTLGHWLANGLVELVLRTIGDLYFSARVTAVEPSPWIYVQGAALGIAATLVAAAKPVLDAARATPALVLRRAALERDTRRGARWAAVAALPLLGLGAVVLTVGPRDLYVAFAGLFAVLAAGALFTPLATVLLMRGLDRLLGRRLRPPAVLAIRGVSASLSRTGVATAALAVAVATVNGVGLMIGSFRTSLAEWLDTTLTADLYVVAEGLERAPWGTEAQQALENIAGVAGISLTRTIVVPTANGELAIRAVRPGARGWGFELVDGEPASAFAALVEGRGVLASERLMFARGLRLGDEVALPTPGGSEELPIVGAFRDFNTGSYSVVLALERYRRDWQDYGVSGIGIDLTQDADAGVVEAAVRDALSARANVRVRSSAGIERLSLEVFDRTFKITEVLRILAAVVAFLGVLSALLAIELERTHELGVLRALGFSPRALATTLLTQTGLLGAAAGLVAIPMGTGLAALLVHVINRRSFGWSMSFVVTPEPLVAGLLLSVAAALLAGLYPAWRASRMGLAAALREE